MTKLSSRWKIMKGKASMSMAFFAVCVCGRFLGLQPMLRTMRSERLSAMNADPSVSSTSENRGGVRVVFIGNSITLHGPLASIGWTNNWGMAASVPEKDYVHLVARGIERETGRKVDMRVTNLAFFERTFESYDFKNIQPLIDFSPEYLIVALGENVRDLKSIRTARLGKPSNGDLSVREGRSKPKMPQWRRLLAETSRREMAQRRATSPCLSSARLDERLADGDWKIRPSGVQRHPATRACIHRRAFSKRSSLGIRLPRLGRQPECAGSPIRVSASVHQWAPGYQRPVDQTDRGQCCVSRRTVRPRCA